MYWTTLLRYDHEAQIKDRRRSVEQTFTSDQLTTARDLFASCSPHADERALASRERRHPQTARRRFTDQF